MGALTQRMSAGRLLWLDYSAYAGRLLANGTIPWLDAGALIAWQRKAQSLLRSDVLTLPVEAVAAAWLAAHPELATAMAAKRRAVFPLKTLLADEALRTHLVELAKGLRASFGGMPLALVAPSPRRWVALAYGQALPGETVAVGDDEADSASVYVADFLRAFGESGIDALLLTETAETEPTTPEAMACYQSTLNVAAHYRWDSGLYLPAASGHAAGDASLAFLVAPRPVAGVRSGLIVPAAFWDGGEAPELPANAFYFAEIPAAATPEKVLERLALLRA